MQAQCQAIVSLCRVSCHRRAAITGRERTCIVSLRRSSVHRLRRLGAPLRVAGRAWRCEETGSDRGDIITPVQYLVLRTISTTAATVLFALEPSLVACADIQYVPLDQATNQAKPLVLKQAVNKNLVWEVLLGGAFVLFGTTVLLENNEALFPAIYRANQAMKMYTEEKSGSLQQQAEAMEVEAAEVQQPKPKSLPQQVEDPLTAAVMEGISKASSKSSSKISTVEEKEVAAAVSVSLDATTSRKQGKEENVDDDDAEWQGETKSSTEAPATAAAEEPEKAEEDAVKTYPSELSVDADITSPITTTSVNAIGGDEVEGVKGPALSTHQTPAAGVTSLDALEAALAAKLRQEEQARQREQAQDPLSLDALEALLEAKIKAQKEARGA